MISLQQLRERGGFVGAKPVPKKIHWVDESGEELDGEIWIVPQSFGAIEELRNTADPTRSQGARAIALHVRLGTDAQEQMTYEEAFALDTNLAIAMVAAINEVSAPRTIAR